MSLRFFDSLARANIMKRQVEMSDNCKKAKEGNYFNNGYCYDKSGNRVMEYICQKGGKKSNRSNRNKTKKRKQANSNKYSASRDALHLVWVNKERMPRIASLLPYSLG